MKVRKKTLLLIAGLVWGAAGFNILRIGIIAYSAHWNVWNLLISLVIYLLFQLFIFSRMVKKHTVRIVGYEEEKQFFLKFFDIKAFCIMGFMIALGVGLRVSGICPDIFIAVFYTGLGASLLTAGILFLVNFVRHRPALARTECFEKPTARPAHWRSEKPAPSSLPQIPGTAARMYRLGFI